MTNKEIVTMATEQTVNLNVDAKTLEQCLKSTSNFGETIYRNICTGAQTAVAWGSVDWTIALVLTGLGVAFLLFLVAFSVMVALDR